MESGPTFRDLESNPMRYLGDCLDLLEPKIFAMSIAYVSAMIQTPVEVLLEYLKFPHKDVIRRAESHDFLTIEESRLLLGVFEIFKEVELITRSPSRPRNFHSEIWLGKWMRETVPALNDTPPSKYLSTLEGQAVIKSLLACAVSGGYR